MVTRRKAAADERYIIDGVEYVSPLQAFTGTSGEKELLEKWKKHYKRLGIGTIEEHWADGKAVELLVNREQNDKVWNMPCMVGDCYIKPPHPHFGSTEYAVKVFRRIGKIDNKYIDGEV